MQGSAEVYCRSIPACSVDMILTDPPYSEHTHANLGKETRGDGYKTRKVLEFPALSDTQIQRLASDFVRICAGWILVFTDERSIGTWGNSLELAGGRWLRTGHWVKNNPMPQMSGDRPAVGTEPIVIAHGSGPLTWNGHGKAATWTGPRESGATHPNQKPVWLIKALIDAFAPPEAIVLDPFIGSGTTAVAALDSSRPEREEAAGSRCHECGRRLSATRQLPPVVDARVIGVEKDPVWALRSALRVSKYVACPKTNQSPP